MEKDAEGQALCGGDWMRRREVIALFAGLGCLPVQALAQPSSVRRLAQVHPSTPVTMLTYEGAQASGLKGVPALLDELRRWGFVEGQNLLVERYSGQGQSDRYAELARQVVNSKPDAIFTVTTRMAHHLRAATTTIPIVAITTDPVANGLTESLARPGGNITGVVTDAGLSIIEKRFEMVREVLPNVRTIAALAPEATLASPEGRQWQETAQRIGLKLVPWALASPIDSAEYERAFNQLQVAPVDAVVVGTG